MRPCPAGDQALFRKYAKEVLMFKPKIINVEVEQKREAMMEKLKKY
ncbi:hypothetical protein GCM10017764_19540 [Sphingobacterium griseoflavum]|uniref:Uncharacterized protein n=1 Tax=Sphingobacterium griseoflavum TaxID=1474952 RepID=A0ABQ3HUN5_9SPHI|nr:hypothetical protein GCM10017764_19540 [Sphingobacterium griseoflavum]